jgi:hypothetical protein
MGHVTVVAATPSAVDEAVTVIKTHCKVVPAKERAEPTGPNATSKQATQ